MTIDESGLNIDQLLADDSGQNQQEAPPSIDPSQIEQMNARLAQLETENKRLAAWKEDASRFFGGGESQANGVPEDHAQTLINPERYRESIRNEANQVIQQERARQELENYAATKYPDLMGLKNEVFYNAGLLYQEAVAKGQYNGDDRSYIDAAVNDLQGRLAASTKGRPLKEMALTMQTGSVVQQGQKKSIAEMSDAEFEAFSQKVRSSFPTL